MFYSDGVFGKYVKVEILSHHGNEYFCPISSFKIYGVSEIELIGADDDDDDDHDEPIHFQPVPETTSTPQDDSMVLNMIKATFQKIIAGVFDPNEQVKNLDMSSALAQSSLEGFTFLYEITCPNCDDNRLRDVYFLLAFNYAQLSNTLTMNEGLKQALAASVCQSYGFNITDSLQDWTKVSQSGFRMVEFYATLFGSSRIIALCNLISIAQGQSPTVQSPIILPPWKTSTVASMTNPTLNDTLKAKEQVKEVESPLSDEKKEAIVIGNVQFFVNLIFILYARWRFKIVC